jgi:tRNA(His) guanylyltransferase
VRPIGTRMKENYEDRYRIKLTRRMPVILRLDGKAFHTLTRGMERPFDDNFQKAMQYVAIGLCQECQGAKCAYVQSDEISILLTDFDALQTEAWFDYNLQKMVSVAAGWASVLFSRWTKKRAVFDCRAFNVPKEEVCNYFIWRQQDWIRNSIQMLAHAHYSHKELHKKNTKDMHEMLYAKDVN